MKVGLFFGSFNPIHIGHLIIANVMHQSTDLDEVWFVVSPQNPFKKNNNLLHEFDRYDMVQAAIESDFHFRVTDIEFSMPKPSYTIDTLVVLEEKYPNHQFSLIIGGDNLVGFPKWKNYQMILDNYGLYVYPRPESGESELRDHPSVRMVDAPKMDISATLIRKMIRNNQSIKYLVPDRVNDLILSRRLFV